MKILDKIGIGRKKKDSQPAKKPTPVSKADQKKDAKVDKPIKKEPAKQTKVKSAKTPGDLGRSYAVLVRPIISEKGTMLAGTGKYVFAVSPRANKSEVRKSIEGIYGVDVEKVNMIKVQGKQRRYGRSVGRTSAWKKAVVTVKKGQKIPGIIENVGA